MQHGVNYMKYALSTFVKHGDELLFTLDFTLILVLFGLITAVLIDPYLKKERRRLFLIASVLTGSLVVQGQLDTYLGMCKISWIGCILVAMYGYQVRPIVIALFIWMLNPEKKQKWVIWMLIANALVYATAPFSDIAFGFTSDFVFVRGPLGYVCHVISGLMLITLLILALQRFGRRKHLETAIPIGIAAIIIGAVLKDTFVMHAQWISYLTSSMVGGCMFFYIWIHLQLAREHDRALKNEQKLQFVIARVQPHFLYGVLSTIQSLCMTNPESACEVAQQFGSYLNQNTDSLRITELIPFSKELEHTKKYVELETKRFPNFRVEYDIKAEDFLVPALSLQPLLENAIHQDERVREQGLIRVNANRENDFFEIIVWDNGTGFQNTPDHVSDSLHIEVQDVRDRIESMCGGKMEVETFPTDGTIVTIKIPVN